MGWLWQTPSSPNKGSNQENPSPPAVSPALPAAATTDNQPASDPADREIANFIAHIQADLLKGQTTPEPRPAAQQTSTTSTTSTPPSDPAPASRGLSTPSLAWLWGSASQQSAAPPHPSHSSTSTSTSTSTSSSSASADPLSPEAAHRGEANPPSPTKGQPADGSAPRQAASRNNRSPPPPTPPQQQQQQQQQQLDPISESLLPTTMSCTAAFDAAFYCQSLGGQFTAVYRHGRMRSCGDLWDDYWFCMRTRTMSGPMRRDAIRAHYRDKELAKYGPGRPSSTDIWEPRQERLPADSVFIHPFNLPDISDEEWRLADIERRRAVQAALSQPGQTPQSR